jgi:hypothetical protein
VGEALFRVSLKKRHLVFFGHWRDRDASLQTIIGSADPFMFQMRYGGEAGRDCSHWRSQSVNNTGAALGILFMGPESDTYSLAAAPSVNRNDGTDPSGIGRAGDFVSACAARQPDCDGGRKC